jgi:hypothetical protein
MVLKLEPNFQDRMLNRPVNEVNRSNKFLFKFEFFLRLILENIQTHT